MSREIFNPEEYNFIKELARKYGIEYGEITYVLHSGEVIGKDVLRKERIGKDYDPKENIEETYQAVKILHKAINRFSIDVELAALKLKEVMIKVHDLFYEEYKKVGCPFGDSDEGMIAWIKMMKLKENMEYREHYKKEIKQMITDIKRK